MGAIDEPPRKSLGWWVLGGEGEGEERRGADASRGCRRVVGRRAGGVLGRGQEVTRVRVCIIRSSLPRVYTLLVFDVVQIARLARACDAPALGREEEGESETE